MPDDALHQLYPSVPLLAGGTRTNISTMPTYASVTPMWHHTTQSPGPDVHPHRIYPHVPLVVSTVRGRHTQDNMLTLPFASSVPAMRQHPHSQVSGPLSPSASQRAAVAFTPLPYISSHSISVVSPYTNTHRVSMQQYICQPDQVYCLNQSGNLPGPPSIGYSHMASGSQFSLPRRWPSSGCYSCSTDSHSMHT